MIRILAIALTFSLMGACSLKPGSNVRPAAHYDFGVAPAVSTKPINANLVVADVEAPQWLQRRGLLYRLVYRNEQQLQPYASSSWVAPPPELLSTRLRQYFANGKVSAPEDRTRADYLLRVELESFEQKFMSPSSSSALVRAKATLVNTLERRVHAQKTFALEEPAPSADAAGGAAALATASNALSLQIHDWVANELRTAGPRAPSDRTRQP